MSIEVALYFGRPCSFLFYAVDKNVDVLPPQMPVYLCIGRRELLRYWLGFSYTVTTECMMMFNLASP